MVNNMDAQLQFEVVNQFINRVDKFKPVADSRNYLYAHFETQHRQYFPLCHKSDKTNYRY